MNYCTPEKAGISSAYVLKFLKHLDSYNLSTHSVILARGNDIFLECYYAPFNKDFKHRMYSVTKTFVSVAIGFCEQDGLISLDDPMVKYFPEYVNEKTNEKMLKTTVRDMLKMETSHDHNVNWFYSGTTDRIETYFRVTGDKNSNCLFSYDSQGSFMLGVIVEKVTGKPLVEYLKDKVLRDIGFSEDAYCLKAPGGYSWGDSAMMCTAMDLALFTRFVLNKGTWNGKRYLNKEYLDAATDTAQVSNADYGFLGHGTYGYGYQIWGCPHNCFSMYGMGGQLGFCDPEHDLVFVINSDNQGNPCYYEQIFDCLYNDIIANLNDAPISECDKQKKVLDSYIGSRKLFALNGNTDAPIKDEINGRRFICEGNPMSIKWFQFDFDGKRAVLHYENAQGVKELPFGLGYNEFGKFPQVGYSDMIGSVGEPGHKYDCAVSADFPEPQKIRIRVQIIDKYFGNLAMIFGFKDKNTASVKMVKCAEAFLDEYQGLMNAKAL
jgi:CubicO group peptidase (beta-lactamase class C family)